MQQLLINQVEKKKQFIQVKYADLLPELIYNNMTYCIAQMLAG